MKKTMITGGVAILAGVTLAACGNSGGSSGAATAATGASANAPGSGATAQTVAVKQLSGVGKVLVDSSGMAIYNTTAEASGKIVCTSSSACTSFWKPVMVAGKPSGTGDVGKLGTIKRPEGTTQLTVDGQPAYTFASDSPGKVTGNNYTDHFSGHTLMWHALAPGGKAVAASSKAPAPTTTGGGSGGYGY